MPPELQILTTVITGIVGLLALIVAFATWLAKTRTERGEDMAEDARVMVKLDFIGDDVKDIKAEYRNFREELKEVRAIAVRAEESATAAHRRLDRAGVDIRHLADKEGTD